MTLMATTTIKFHIPEKKALRRSSGTCQTPVLSLQNILEESPIPALGLVKHQGTHNGAHHLPEEGIGCNLEHKLVTLGIEDRSLDVAEFGGAGITCGGKGSAVQLSLKAGGHLVQYLQVGPAAEGPEVVHQMGGRRQVWVQKVAVASGGSRKPVVKAAVRQTG